MTFSSRERKFSSSLRGRGSTVLFSVVCNLLFSVVAAIDVADVVVLLEIDYNHIGDTHYKVNFRGLFVNKIFSVLGLSFALARQRCPRQHSFSK